MNELVPAVIIGAGSYSVVMRELARECGYHVVLCLDDAREVWGNTEDGVPVSGPIEQRLRDLAPTAVIVAIGENRVRVHYLEIAARAGHQLPSLVSPQAVVSPSAQISRAVYVHPMSHVWSCVTLGQGAIVSPQASIAHHTSIGVGAFVSSGARVGASIDVGKYSFIGIGATVSTTVSMVGDDVVIGAGAVVIHDVEARSVHVGNPSRLVRFLP